MRKKQQEAKRSTLKDVAAAANVSAITVSRALRNPELVSPSVRNHVLRIVEEMGFVPNPAASALASKKADVLGVLIPSVTNNVFAEVLRGIYAAAAHSRYSIQLANTHYSGLEEEKLLRLFISQRPAGLIVTGVDQSPAARALLSGAGCPVVQIMDSEQPPVDMLVGFSHCEGAKVATSHLVGQGYRRIAFLGARMDPRTHRRLDGYSQALRQSGLFDNELIVTTHRPSSVELGCELLSELMAKKPDADAVFCNNDDIALGALFECQRRHINVPEAFGIVGFNDLGAVGFSHPPITTIRTFRDTIGHKAVEMLLSRIEGKSVAEPRLDVGFELMARKSTQRPRLQNG